MLHSKVFHSLPDLILRLSVSLFFAARAGLPCGRLGAGPPPERARRVRLLCAGAVLVAVLLRGGRRARQRRTLAGPVQRAALLLRGARPVAAIRPRLSRNIASGPRRGWSAASCLDARPDAGAGLIYNEWDKHGTCSGLGTRAYFETIRKARAAVKIPEQFLELVAAQDGRAGRGRGRLHQGQSGAQRLGDLGDLRQRAG